MTITVLFTTTATTPPAAAAIVILPTKSMPPSITLYDGRQMMNVSLVGAYYQLTVMLVYLKGARLAAN